MAKKTKAQMTPDNSAAKKPRSAPLKPDFAICRVEETAVVSTKHEYSRRFGKGAVVDLAEKIADDLYLGDIVREGCFDRISAAEAARVAEEAEHAKREADEAVIPEGGGHRLAQEIAGAMHETALGQNEETNDDTDRA